MTDLSHIYTKLHETRDEFILRARRERDLQTEVYRLRAELAAAKEEAQIQFEAREADIRDIRNLGIARQKAEAERDTLRELLREARRFISTWAKPELVARIDAKLAKGDGE